MLKRSEADKCNGIKKCLRLNTYRHYKSGFLGLGPPDSQNAVSPLLEFFLGRVKTWRERWKYSVTTHTHTRAVLWKLFMCVAKVIKQMHRRWGNWALNKYLIIKVDVLKNSFKLCLIITNQSCCWNFPPLDVLMSRFRSYVEKQVMGQ